MAANGFIQVVLEIDKVQSHLSNLSMAMALMSWQLMIVVGIGT
jgi:hypothetical protein